MSAKFILNNHDLHRILRAKPRDFPGVQQVLKAIGESWPKKGSLAVAVSGGVDSMVLLTALYWWRQAHDPTRSLTVLHVNHGLRGGESDKDEELVRRFAEFLGLEFFSTRLTWEGEKPSQAACRKKRLEFFAEQAKDSKVAFAHHLDDQAETIFLRLLRGSGLRGLRGMKVDTGKALRPFLGLTKSELLTAAQTWGIPWRDDRSNDSSKYERNWLRNEIFPLLEERRPGFAKRLSALGAEARGAVRDRKTPVHFAHGSEEKFYAAADFASWDSAGLSHQFSINRNHSESLLKLLKKGQGELQANGRVFKLSAGVLWTGRRMSLASPKIAASPKLLRITGPLGRWTLEPGADIRFHGALGSGAKKEFQKFKVPVFFRGQIPLVMHGRNATLLVHPLPAIGQVEWTPLGRWWLTLHRQSPMVGPTRLPKEKTARQ